MSSKSTLIILSYTVSKLVIIIIFVYFRLTHAKNRTYPPDLPRHGCNSDRGPAASGGPTVLANDRNVGRLRLNASRHDDNDTHATEQKISP